MERVIVFGATGSIGLYLVDYLKKTLDPDKYEVIGSGRRNTDFFSGLGVKYIQCDITRQEDFDSLPVEKVRAVINLTGLMPAHTKNFDPFAYVDTNIKGSLRILEYARKAGADRALYTQTWSDQGGYWGKEDVLSPKMPRKLIYTGDHAFYAITKTTVVEMMEHYKQEYGLKIFVFRLPNVYMYHPDIYYYVDGKQKLTAYRYMIERAAKGENIEMWGDPEAFKDILYIKDLCQMIYKSLLVDIEGGTYNAGTGVKTTLREQIEGMIEIFSPLDRKSEIILKPEGAGFTSFVMDIENARQELGYEPEYLYLDYLRDYKREREKKRFDAFWTNREYRTHTG